MVRVRKNVCVVCGKAVDIKTGYVDDNYNWYCRRCWTNSKDKKSSKYYQIFGY